jgi:hypothetical protein
MPNVIDYTRGERIDPVTGKPIKRSMTGVVPTDFADMLLPVAAGGDQFYAPGFGSNLLEDLEYYDNPAAPQQQPVYQGPALSGQLPGNSRGNGGDARADDKSRAGAINDFGNWVDAIMHGTTALGFGGPFKAVAGQVTGEADYGADFGNANQEDPEGWADAVDQATGQMPPGSTSSAITAKAAQIYGETHPGWGGGGEPDNAAQHEALSEQVNSGAISPQEGIMREIDSLGSITTSSGTKPSGQGQGNSGGNRGPGKGTGSGSSSQGGNYSDARDDPGGSFGGNEKGGGGRGGDGGNRGGSGDKPDNAGATAGGGKANPGNTHFAEGGYVQNTPASVSARRPKEPQQQAQQAQQPQQQARPRMPDAFSGMNPTSSQRFAQSTKRGFEAGGFVPSAGYQDGGAVAPNSGGPDDPARTDPSLIPVDNKVDNQPIMADEREFVINRESADILGPELLNAINDPTMALALSDLVEDVLALKAGGMAGPMAGGGPAPSPMPEPAPRPMPGMSGAPTGAGPSQDAMPQQRTAGPTAPSAYRKGGYVTTRGSLTKVRY